MLLKQVFKTLEGVRKRALFETAHCDRKWVFVPIRCVNGEPDETKFVADRIATYTWRLERRPRFNV